MVDRSWERRLAMASIVIAMGYLVAAAVSTALPRPASMTWLPLHLALAGSAATAIAGLVPFFSAAFAATPPAHPGLRAAAIATVALGAAGVTIGLSTERVGLATGGGVLFVIGMALTGLAASRSLRGSLRPGRALVIGGYLAALLNVSVGASLTTLFLAGWPPAVEAWAGLRPAHAWLNLVGFVSLVIATTLIHLLPTVLGTRISASRSALVTASGIALGAPAVAAGHVLGWDLLARFGALAVLAGAAGLAAYAARVWRRRGRWSSDAGWHRFASVGLVSAVVWFELAIVGVSGWVLTEGLAPGAAALGTLAGPLVIGWVGLSVVAAATHLLPAVGPGDQATHARQRRILGRAATTRLMLVNAGVAALWLGSALGLDLLSAAGFVLVVAALGTSTLLLAAGLGAAASATPSAGPSVVGRPRR